MPSAAAAQSPTAVIKRISCWPLSVFFILPPTVAELEKEACDLRLSVRPIVSASGVRYLICFSSRRAPWRRWCGGRGVPHTGKANSERAACHVCEMNLAQFDQATHRTEDHFNVIGRSLTRVPHHLSPARAA